jgi:hypothetical protein
MYIETPHHPATDPAAGDTLLVGDAARLLGVSPDRVRSLERSGALPARRTKNGVRLFSCQDVITLARTREARRAAAAASVPVEHERR